MQPAGIPQAQPPVSGRGPVGGGPGGGATGTPLLDREFGAASLSGLRGAVLASAEEAGLDNDRAIDVMLAMHELAANVVRHGLGQGRLLMEVTPHGLRCQVSDHTDPETGGTPAFAAPGGSGPLGESVAGDVSVSWPVEHGHGLWIVRRTADQVQMTTGPDGSAVSVIFTLPGR